MLPSPGPLQPSMSSPLGPAPASDDVAKHRRPARREAVQASHHHGRLLDTCYRANLAHLGLVELEELLDRGGQRFVVLLPPGHILLPAGSTQDDKPQSDQVPLLPHYVRAVATPDVVDWREVGSADHRGLIDDETLGPATRRCRPPPVVYDADTMAGRGVAVEFRSRTGDIDLIETVETSPVLSANEVRLLLRATIAQAGGEAFQRTLQQRLYFPLAAEILQQRSRGHNRARHGLETDELLAEVAVTITGLIADYTDPHQFPPACDFRKAVLLAGTRDLARAVARNRHGSVPSHVAVVFIRHCLDTDPDLGGDPFALTAQQWHHRYRHERTGDIPAVEHWVYARQAALTPDHHLSLSPTIDRQDQGRTTILSTCSEGGDDPAFLGPVVGLVTRLLREIRLGKPLSRRQQRALQGADPAWARRWIPHHPDMINPWWENAERGAVAALLSEGDEEPLRRLRRASFAAFELSNNGGAEAAGLVLRTVADPTSRSN